MAQFELGFLNGLQNAIGCSFCDKLFTLITHLGDAGIFWIALAVVFLFFKKTRRMGICMGIALVLGLIFGNGILKNVFQRTRPFYYEGAAITKEILLIGIPSDYSFPSGHTLASFNAAFAILFHNKKWGAGALVLAALIAFSRMYLFVHFPTDILGGILLAAICATASFYIMKRFLPENDVAKS